MKLMYIHHLLSIQVITRAGKGDVLKRLLFVPAIFLAVCSAPAQPSYHFTKGLAVAVPGRYGREAVYTDGLAYQLYGGTLLEAESILHGDRKRKAEGDSRFGQH